MTAMIADTGPTPTGTQSARTISAIVKGRWDAYLTWREQKKAAAHFNALNDHYLKDIGINRSEMEAVARGTR